MVRFTKKNTEFYITSVDKNNNLIFHYKNAVTPPFLGHNDNNPDEKWKEYDLKEIRRVILKEYMMAYLYVILNQIYLN